MQDGIGAVGSRLHEVAPVLGDDDLDEVGSVLLWSSVEPVSAVKRSLLLRSSNVKNLKDRLWHVVTSNQIAIARRGGGSDT